MQNYFYFAVIRFEEVNTAGGERAKRVPVTHYGRNSYASAEDCINANVAWMASHLGERFSICGFPKRLNLDERGVSHGFVDDSVDNPQ